MTDDQNQGHVPATRRKVRSGEDFDFIIGFLAFWAVVLLVVTVWMEVTAQPALGWALGLLAMLLAIYGMILLRPFCPCHVVPLLTVRRCPTASADVPHLASPAAVE